MLQATSCQNCKKGFRIDPEDFDFYQKINVPPPTWCPDCRMQRRFAWRNERKLFRNTCAATGKNLISSFSPESGIVVYDRDYWWSDDWDVMDTAMDYDFSRPFFEQFHELLKKAPMPAVFNARTTNSEYCSYSSEFKDAYLVSASYEGENVTYASRCHRIKDSMDIFSAADSDVCYEIVASDKLYGTAFAQESESCSDCRFIHDCKACSNCFGCVGLRGKSYYIWNQPYTKEDYFAKLKEIDIGDYRNLEQAKDKLKELRLKAVHKYANILNSPNCTGDNLFNSANCKSCFMVNNNVKDCKFLVNAVGPFEGGYDGYGVGAGAELLYEAFDSGIQGSRLFFTTSVYGCRDTQYSMNCHGSQNLFGCIGLRSKQYCILNKQYTKEEYGELLPRIIAHMNKMPYVGKNSRTYAYGEFFPVEMSPFAYNETIAQEYFPLNEKSAGEQGFFWKDPVPPSQKSTLKASDLPDHINDSSEAIADEIIECMDCGIPYRILKKEFLFLKKMNVALPRRCPECRHKTRFEAVNPTFLHHRACACAGGWSRNKSYQNTAAHFHGFEPCPNEFETTYAPDRPETVYCEKCYNSEVA